MKVKDLIAKLSSYDAELDVISMGPDCGGYDCEYGEFNIFYVDETILYMYHSDDEEDIAKHAT